jgi:hypothetical protein
VVEHGKEGVFVRMLAEVGVKVIQSIGRGGKVWGFKDVDMAAGVGPLKTVEGNKLVGNIFILGNAF